ncbi:MAG TPA: hypothetical protein VM434_18875 [Beijerinckiaceae bacterium]|nr:hypothetical protein [Beijerinckiaceae bacterium]
MRPHPMDEGPYRGRIKAQELAQELFPEVELRHARGLSLDAAKREVLEERVPGFIAEHGEEVGDLVIQMIMTVPESGFHPQARRAFRNHRWRKLVEPHVKAGGRPPSALARKLYDWFGIVPKGLR